MAPSLRTVRRQAPGGRLHPDARGERQDRHHPRVPRGQGARAGDLLRKHHDGQRYGAEDERRGGRDRRARTARVRSAAGGQADRSCHPAPRRRAGAVRPAASAAVPITRCGRYGTTSGWAAHCASSAAATGPRPKPALSASAARRALSASPGDRSCTQAVAGPNTMPEHSPASARPAASSGRRVRAEDEQQRGHWRQRGEWQHDRAPAEPVGGGPADEQPGNQRGRVDGEQPVDRAGAQAERAPVDDQHRRELVGAPADGEHDDSDAGPGRGSQ